MIKAEGQGIGVRGIVITRGLHEALRLGLHLGASAASFYGLSGMGNLVSCASLPSHPSYAAGRALSAGKNIPGDLLDEILAILNISHSQQIELPITEAIAAIAKGKIRPRLAIDMLMKRSATQE